MLIADVLLSCAVFVLLWRYLPWLRGGVEGSSAVNPPSSKWSRTYTAAAWDVPTDLIHLASHHIGRARAWVASTTGALIQWLLSGRPGGVKLNQSLTDHLAAFATTAMVCVIDRNRYCAMINPHIPLVGAMVCVTPYSYN